MNVQEITILLRSLNRIAISLEKIEKDLLELKVCGLEVRDEKDE